MSTAFKAGQFVISKYLGAGGDLLVGKVTSVRRNGQIVLLNLLTEKVALKQAAILEKRNAIVKKRDATRVLAVAKKNGRKAAQLLAAEICRAQGHRNPVRLVPDDPNKLWAVVDALNPAIAFGGAPWDNENDAKDFVRATGDARSFRIIQVTMERAKKLYPSDDADGSEYVIVPAAR